jgi:hypothetical protein
MAHDEPCHDDGGGGEAPRKQAIAKAAPDPVGNGGKTIATLRTQGKRGDGRDR